MVEEDTPVTKITSARRTRWSTVLWFVIPFGVGFIGSAIYHFLIY